MSEKEFLIYISRRYRTPTPSGIKETKKITIKELLLSLQKGKVDL